jgi:hypothetical protein
MAFIRTQAFLAIMVAVILGGTARADTGMAQLVSQLEASVNRMAAQVDVTPVAPKSNGIKFRIAAAGDTTTAVVSAVSAIQTEVDNAIANSTATEQQLNAFIGLVQQVDAATNEIQDQLTVHHKDAISITDMFDMQTFMNHLSQLSEMSTAVINAANTAISSMARNVKG